MTLIADLTWTELERSAGAAPELFDRATVAELPEPAQRLLATSLPHGTPLARAVELTMRGRIKLGAWLPFTSRQILRAGVGFVWEPVVGGRVVRFVGADALGPEGARMEFRLHGRVPVVRASGDDVARSAAGRLAAETVVWLPQALTPQAGAVWTPIDDDRAAVELAGPSGPTRVEVTVDARGALVGLVLRRWKDSAKPPAAVPFGGSVTSMLDVDGVRIAGAGEVGWDRGTPDEDAGVFFRYEVTSARFFG